MRGALGGLWWLMGDAASVGWVEFAAVTGEQENILFDSIGAYISNHSIMLYWMSVMTTLYKRRVAHRPAACEFVTNMIINTPQYDGHSVQDNALALGRFITTLEALMLDAENLERLRDNRALILRLQPYHRYTLARDFDRRSSELLQADVNFQKNYLGLNHGQLQTIFEKLYRFGTLSEN